MFIQTPPIDREMKILLRGIKMKLGSVPPHWELYAGLNPVRFKMFMEEINYLSDHPTIEPVFFTFLRLVIATRHGYDYCERFNRDYLLGLGYTPEQIAAVTADRDALPLDGRHRALFAEALGAVEGPASFGAANLARLHALEWSDAEIFDAIDHAAFLFKFHTILEVYLED